MNIYEYDDYKLALKALVTQRKAQFGSRFTFERMAQACGVQKTYLSKVMNSHAHLSADQLFAACEFLKLTSDESEFLLELRELQVAQNKTRIDLIRKRIQFLRKSNLKTESLIEVEQEQSVQNHLWEYYSDIDLQLTHLFLTVPRYSSMPSAICEKLGISEERLKGILLKLQNWNIISFEKGKYIAREPKLHLSEDSPAFVVFGILNRLKTLEHLRRHESNSNDYHFSVFFSAESVFQNRFKKRVLELLKETQLQVVESKAQEVYQLNIDFFKWS